MEKENKLQVVKQSQRSNEVQNIIQNSLELGFPILFEDVDEGLDNNITAVLKNQRKLKGSKTMFKYIDKWYDLHPSFNFYITTKLSRPHYSSDVCVMATLLNF